MQQVRPRVSYADVELWPEDGCRYELYDGEPFVMPAPTLRHQRVVLNVAGLLREYERAAGGTTVVSPFDIVLSHYDVVQPDVVFFLEDRLPQLVSSGPARIRPDLAVEVLSPATTVNDRGQKMALLAHFGVEEYWLIDPVRNCLECYALEAGVFVLLSIVSEHDVVESRVLPGFSCPAARVFDR